MQPQIIRGVKARLAQHLLRLNPASISGSHAGSNRAAVRFHSDQLDLQPMVVASQIVAQQRWRLVEVDDQDIDIAVVIEIAECAPPAAMGFGYRGACGATQLFESAATQIAKDHTWRVHRISRK